MRDGSELAPDPRHEAQHDDDRGWGADHVFHEVLHRSATIPGRHQSLELSLVGRATSQAVVVYVGWLVGNHLVDPRVRRCSLERERGTR